MGIKVNELRELLQEVSQYPQGSKEWQRTMHRLLIELQNLPGLLKSSHPDYLDALNRTWEKVSRDICREFKPQSESFEKSLVNWINGYLYWRIRDLYTCNVSTVLSLDTPIKINEHGEHKNLIEILRDKGSETYILYGLDRYIEQLQQQESQCLTTKILNYIEQDPQNQLNNCYLQNYPHCHCQLISQRRYLQEPPKTFAQIAQEFDIPSRKLMNHWYSKCIPLWQRIVEDLGYRADE
ncbi:MAG: hypothetical protein ACRC06_14515 [Waterburya sp.]